jgi:hypothetical protein
MSYERLRYKLRSKDRALVRREIINLFLDEEPGNGCGADSSRYHYIVKEFDDYNIELHRPAGLNKGFDFTVHITGMYFKKRIRYTNPSHGDIILALHDVKNHCNKSEYQLISEQIQNIFYDNDFDVHYIRNMEFCDYEGEPRPIVIILLAIKWLFIEQDITYWNWSGRNMLMEKLDEEGLI